MTNVKAEPVNGELLKRARKKLGLTQLGMSKHLGFSVNQQLLSFWENNQRTIPDLVLKKARKVLREIKKAPQLDSTLRSPNCKKEHPIRGKSVVKPTVIKKAYLTTSGIAKCSKLSGKKTHLTPHLVDFEESYPKDSMGRYVLEAYITFKRSKGRFPTVGDFADGTFKEITQKEVLEHFPSFSVAKKLAGELFRSTRTRRAKRNIFPVTPIREPEDTPSPQTAITYIDPDDEWNWLKALYPERDLSYYSKHKNKIKVKERTFTWKELFLYRSESERLVFSN